jgi:Uma2 family endonuclease
MRGQLCPGFVKFPGDTDATLGEVCRSGPRGYTERQSKAAFLHHPMSTAPLRRLTVAEYLHLERSAQTRSEFYRGEMFAMAGATRRHNLIVTNLISDLREQLRGQRCEVYPVDMKVQIAKNGLFTYPDVVIVCGRPEFFDDVEDVLLNPTLLIEVLSKSTYSYDRGFKSGSYRKLPSLAAYVLIEQEFPHIEHYQRSNPAGGLRSNPAGGLRSADETWLLNESDALDKAIELPSIGCRLELKSVYDKVSFETESEGETTPAS